MIEFDIGTASTQDLLHYYAEILDELKRRGIVRTRNNPVADYTEWLVAERLGLQLVPNSKAGYDAMGANGERVQIKARRLDPSNRSTQLSVIRNLDANDFDYLVGVLFNRDFSIVGAYKIPRQVVCQHARFRQHQNGHILHLRRAILMAEGVEDITDILRNS